MVSWQSAFVEACEVNADVSRIGREVIAINAASRARGLVVALALCKGQSRPQIPTGRHQPSAVAKALASIASSSTSSLHDVQVRQRPSQRGAVCRDSTGEGSRLLRLCSRVPTLAELGPRAISSSVLAARPQEALDHIPHDQLETLEENDSITALYLEMIWDQK